MSYIFISEANNLSNEVTKQFKKEFSKINAEISKSKVPGLKKLKAETISPEEMFDIKSFTNDEIEEQTTTGSVGGSFEGPLFSSPIKKSSLFAPEGTPEHKEGKKILKRMEKPIGKIYSKKNLEEIFLVAEEDIEETATTGGVGGSYVQPKIWAKNRKEWRGTRKQYPGGKFVNIPERCKKFPYCNQGAGSVELTDYPKDKLTPVFEAKSMYDMYDDEIYHLRDSDYLRLIEIIESINNLRQFPAIKKLWELYKEKFDGYVSKYLIERTNKIIEDKYQELIQGKKIDDEIVKESDKKSDGKKEQDYEKVMKVVKSVENVKQFNSALKMIINMRVKYEDSLSKEEVEKLNNVLHSKMEEIKDNKTNISEIKTIHRKITD